MTVGDWFAAGVGGAVILGLIYLVVNSDAVDDDLRTSYLPSEDAMNYRLPGSFETGKRR
ncbi:MAG: hypothetical protein J4F42_12885 [Desulfurellaceae bacterium]|nr:hypothetical protein [Desulfurellaceae bacterium]